MPFDYNDPDTKAAVDAMVKEAVEKATTGLANKNSELLGEVKKFKEFKGTAEELQSKLAQIEQASLEEQGKYKELLDSERASHASTLEDLKKQISAKDQSLQSLVVDNGLKDALVKANVKKELLPAAEAMFKGQIQIKETEKGLAAMAGDKPLNDFIIEWAATDQGKAFVVAPANNGGSAPGNPGGGNPTPKNEAAEAAKKKGDLGGYLQAALNQPNEG